MHKKINYQKLSENITIFFSSILVCVIILFSVLIALLVKICDRVGKDKNERT